MVDTNNTNKSKIFEIRINYFDVLPVKYFHVGGFTLAKLKNKVLILYQILFIRSNATIFCSIGVKETKLKQKGCNINILAGKRENFNKSSFRS